MFFSSQGTEANGGSQIEGMGAPGKCALESLPRYPGVSTGSEVFLFAMWPPKPKGDLLCLARVWSWPRVFFGSWPRKVKPSLGHAHRCPLWLVCYKTRGPWFRWGLFHLPGPSIFPKGHLYPPMVMPRCFLGSWPRLQTQPAGLRQRWRGLCEEVLHRRGEAPQAGR